MAEGGYSSKTLDHLGLVSGVCKEFDLAGQIDRLIPALSPEQHVTTGQAVEAMVLNGLGFVNQRLYLVSKFFEDKPVGRLIAEGIEAGHLNDDRLGRALDSLYEHGVTPLFAGIATDAMKKLGRQPKDAHLGSSTFHVHGGYNSGQEEGAVLHLTYGHSKDHRPDLPQAALQLIADHLSGIPLHMEVLNGNSSDSTAFRLTLETFSAQLKLTGVERIIADSKLYCQQTLEVLSEAKMDWLTRVPHTLGQVKELCGQTEPEKMHWLDEEYAVQGHQVVYADVDQYWLVVHSRQAQSREGKALRRKVSGQSQRAATEWEKLRKQAFHCQEDAVAAAGNWLAKQPYVQLENVGVQQVKRYARRGQPAKGALPEKVEYHLTGSLATDLASYRRELFQQSLFVLASNQKASSQDEQAQMLAAYKGQHSVERGFRFLKDPQIVASSFFVKRPQRVEALLFIMTLCLLIYSLLEYKIRKALEEQNKTVPDQKGKPTARPTARWIFHCFVGIHLLKLPDGKEAVLNLTEAHRTILNLFPPAYLNPYSGFS
jgi:transposase